MKLILSILLAGVLVVTIGMPAAAQQSAADKMFASLDTNTDGKLSEAEFVRMFDRNTPDDQKKQEFVKWDADGDKSISKAEFSTNYTGEKGQEKKR